MAKTFGKFSDLIDFSRASGGTALRRVGYGGELITNGDFSNGATGWSISGESYISNGVAVIYSSSGTVTKITQTGFPVGKALSVTYTIISNTAGGLNLGVSGSYQAIPSTVGTHTVVMKTSSGELEINRLGGATNIVIDNISVKEVLFDQPNAPLTLINHPTNVPRIEYDADGNRLGLLIEEARTNLVSYSESFDNSFWTKQYSSITADTVVAPNGSLVADKWVEGATTNTPKEMYHAYAVAAQAYTLSFYAKSDGVRNVIRASFATGALAQGGGTYFNVGNGTNTGATNYGTTTGTTVGMTDVGDGWYKCYVAVSAAAATYYVDFMLASDANNISYTGDGYSGIYIWGAQLEAGSFPTSYIPTSGAAATRAADVASIPVSEFGYNKSAGTLLAVFQAQDVTSNQQFIVGTDNTSSRWLYSNSGSSDIYNYDGASTSSAAGWVAGSESKAVTATDQSAKSLVVNGGSVSTGATNGNIASLPTEFRIGWSNFGAQQLNGHIKSINYYPRRLTDVQLMALTGASNLIYTEALDYLTTESGETLIY